MNCNRCGNPVDPNSSFCNTCGNQIVQPTVVPQVNNTVVPTVVPQTNGTVVPQKNNSSTVIAIIIVLIVFIGAGCAGVVLLKQTKGTVVGKNTTQNIVYNDPTTKVIQDRTTTSRQGGWGTTTTNRVDVIDDSSVYTINGYKVHVPSGYTATYSNEMLTVVNNTNGQFYMLSIVLNNLSNIDWNSYGSYMGNNGIGVSGLAQTKVGNYDAYTLNLSSNNQSLKAYYVQIKPSNILYIVFPVNSSEEYMHNIILASIGN